MKVLLDSDVLCAAAKGRLPVVLQLSALKPADVAVSIFARLEAERGLRAQPRPQARHAKLLRELLAQVTVLDFGAAEAQQALHIGTRMEASSADTPALSSFDLLTAATALAHRLTLVTGRPEVFAHIPDLDVSNWLAVA